MNRDIIIRADVTRKEEKAMKLTFCQDILALCSCTVLFCVTVQNKMKLEI